MEARNTITIECPKCGDSFSLDETLAGPTIAQIRSDADRKVKEAEEKAASSVRDLQAEKERLAQQARDLANREASVQSEVNQALAAERVKLVETARKSAAAELNVTLEAERARARELAAKLQDAQKAELALRKEKDDLQQRARQLDLEVARQVDSQRKAIEERVSVQLSGEFRLALIEKEKTIADMQAKLEEAQRKALQGSQQLQGEALEIDFERVLTRAFPQDNVESVRTGQRGGDLLLHVTGPTGRRAGTLFWETKRAQAWGADWTSKARHDAAQAKAEFALIVSEVLPKGVQDFACHDGVWVTRPCFATALGLALRQGILATHDARLSAEGRDTKIERLYAYMTGTEFRATIENIALPFRELHDELLSEKRSTIARWKRQERRIERVLMAVANFQGSLQGIVGGDAPALPGFDLEIEEDLAVVEQPVEGAEPIGVGANILDFDDGDFQPVE